MGVNALRLGIRLDAATAIRNILEHNSSIVNKEFLARVPDSSFEEGGRVEIGSPELGDLLSAARWTADHLNQRALSKYGLATVSESSEAPDEVAEDALSAEPQAPQETGSGDKRHR